MSDTATTELIGSQVRCIRQFVEDFKRESPNCPHRNKLRSPISCKKTQYWCQWETCPLGEES